MISVVIVLSSFTEWTTYEGKYVSVSQNYLYCIAGCIISIRRMIYVEIQCTISCTDWLCDVNIKIGTDCGLLD
jgi:hypothetical protein